MKLIPLPTQKYLQECFDYDSETGKLIWKKRPLEHFRDSRTWKIWNAKYPKKIALNANCRGYYCGPINNIKYRAHRVIWKLFYNTEPNLILHENGNTNDNRIEKLSNGDQPLNQRDQKLRSTNSSGIMGVHWRKRAAKWLSRINAEGEQKYLGLFEDFFEACCARKSAEAKYKYHENHGKR